MQPTVRSRACGLRSRPGRVAVLATLRLDAPHPRTVERTAERTATSNGAALKPRLEADGRASSPQPTTTPARLSAVPELAATHLEGSSATSISNRPDEQQQQPLQAASALGASRPVEFVPDDVIKEFEAKLQGDVQSVLATLVAGIGVITWWRGVWSLLDRVFGDSLFGDWVCIFSGLLIIFYIRFKGAKLTNFFPPS